MVSSLRVGGKTGLRRERNGDSGVVLNRLDELAQYFPHGLEYKWRMKPPRLLKPPLKTW